MPSKMSLFNKEIILQIGRSTGWISIVYLLGLLFALPIKMMMTYSGDFHTYSRVNNLFQYDFAIQITLMVTIPILMAIFLFRFLHVKQAADLMHSLPLKREKVFHHYALTGVVFLIVPILITSIVVLVTYTALDLTPYFTKQDILYWTGVTILINLILYTGSIFIAMMTGISVVHAVLSYVFLLFPAGMMVLLFYNLKALLYGFPYDYFLNKNLEKMSPISYAAGLDSRHFQGMVAVIYLCVTIILYWLSLYFYKKRKLEAASDAIAFAKLRSVFKYGVTFCTMLLGGMYFDQIQNSSSNGWTIFGYAVGTILGYFVAEMVLQKNWRVFKGVKGLAIYTVVIILAVTVVKSLGIYEKSIPKSDEISSVYLADNPNILQMKNESYQPFLPKPMKEKSNIDRVRKLHQQILKDKEANLKENAYQYNLYGPYDPHENTFFIYEMKDGSKVIREYRINKQLYTDFYKPIYESAEYKQKTKEIFGVKENDIKYITYRANGPVNKSITISNPKDMKEMISLLKSDILAESYDDSLYFRDRGASIEMNLGKHRVVNLGLKPSYLQVMKWLKDKDLLDKMMVTEDDLDYIVVGKNNVSGMKSPNSLIKEVEKQPGAIKITDKQQMNSLINQTGELNTANYIAVFHYKQGRNTEIFFLDDHHVPGFLKEKIQ